MIKGFFSNARILMLIIFISFVTTSFPIFANDNPPFGLKDMPVKTIKTNKGEVFLQRERADIERLVGYVKKRNDHRMHKKGHDSILWVEFLSRPHPSVKTIKKYFLEASEEFGVPVELLEVIAQVESNWTQVGPTIDRSWGIMHLVQNNYADTLGEAAILLGVEKQILKNDARENIRGAAALLSEYASTERSFFTNIED